MELCSFMINFVDLLREHILFGTFHNWRTIYVLTKKKWKISFIHLKGNFSWSRCALGCSKFEDFLYLPWLQRPIIVFYSNMDIYLFQIKPKTVLCQIISIFFIIFFNCCCSVADLLLLLLMFLIWFLMWCCCL